MMRRRRKSLKFEFIKEGGNFISSNKKPIFIAFLLCSIFIISLSWLYNFLHTASYFDCYAIEMVKLSETEGLEPKKEFFKLSHKVNIFAADPVALSNKIKESHTEFQTVLITKYLPNRLIATIIDRRAVAKIKVGTIYPVDYEGVVLPQVSGEELESLPLIIGLESQPFNPAIGRKIKSQRLPKALNLLALVTQAKGLNGLSVEIIDVSHPENATFKMDGMNVILGESEFGKKLELLQRILNDPKIERKNVDYVDLRFTDVVIGAKQAKK